MLALFLHALSVPAWSASAPPVQADHGMVVSAQHLATDVGVQILRQGGNAVDAAIAVGYALAVVYPAAGNLGGGGFMTLQLGNGQTRFVDFRETAPAAATPDMYLDSQARVRAQASTRGYLAAAVPGTVAGFELARQQYGHLSRQQLLAPAIALARDGFILDAGDVAMLHEATPDFARDPASAAIFLHQNQPWQAGERLVQSDLARTLQAIASDGTQGFYQGAVARKLLQASQAGGGVLSAGDLTGYRARQRQPVECDYRGYHVVSAPPPSSGGVILCEMLNVLEGYPLRELGFHSAQAVHLQIETMRHAYVDRNTYLGDPDFVSNPVDHLLDKTYAASLRALIRPQHATASADLGNPQSRHEGSNTTHYVVVDSQGNAVSVTYTLNDWFGARVTVPGTGVLLNDEMDDFTVKVGVPNSYGLVQGPANAIAPGKRPLSSMTPTIVSRNGKPVLVLGTPGGSRIITTVLQVMLNVLDYGMTVQEAVDAPRFHQQWWPEQTRLEPYALSPDTRAILQSWGQLFEDAGNANHVEAIGVDDHGRLSGANDPRRGTGLAAGY
jgi:gamma-glutamyltranspeptidase/glutathione hydrolase